MVMEESTKAAIVQQHRATVITGDGTGVDAGISSDPEATVLNNNNAGSVSPSVSPNTTGGPASGNSSVYLIGLEFVRQYYTVLHQGPIYLHRFYSDQSCFVHDDSSVVYGLQDIRDRIEQLNFRDCVAKILQVDSQETLGNGVVIQVRGELSNNGQPLRRFMQTFVLAPQTPKLYYVRNDIFHYQDDDICKDDLGGRPGINSRLSNENVEDEQSEEEVELNDSGSHVPSVSAGSPTSEVSNVVETVSPKQPETAPVAATNTETTVEVSVPEVSVLDTKPEPPKVENHQNRPSHGFVSTGAQSGGDNNVGLGGRGPEQPKEPEPVTVAPPPGGNVKTFANLFKSDLTPTASSGTHEFTSRSPFPTKPPPNTGRLGPSPTAAEVAGDAGHPSVSPSALSPQPPPSDNMAGRNLPPRGHNNFGRGDRGSYAHPRDRRERLTSRSSNTTGNDDTGSVDGDSTPRPRPMHTYPDSHQLFVGNLPHTVTIAEIKEIFEVYGRVAEVKILKPNQKNQGIKVPYFCFVVFEGKSSADAAIQDNSKITMKMGENNHRRLNVEEKRPRETGGYGGPPGGYYNRDNRGDNAANTAGPSGSGPSQHQGQGGNNMRGGGNNPSRGMDTGGGRGGGNSNSGGGVKDGGNVAGGNDFRSQNNARPHARTFRGSNRGGGQMGERGGGSGGGAR